MADPTYQNPTFGTIKTKTPATVTEADFLATVETDGSIAKIDPVNLPVSTDTQTELDLKLNIADYNEHFSGIFTSLANLELAIPTGNVGDYATVDTGSGSDAQLYIWDTDEGWVLSGTVAASTTDALPEGSTNLYFTTARVLATLLTGISFITGTAITATDSVLIAFGKLQKQITDILSNKADKTITVVKINSNTTLDDSYNNKVVLLTASCTVTLPNGLATGFNCSFATQAGATMSYSLGGSVTMINNAGTVMTELLTHTIVNTGVANEYLTSGNL